MQDGVCPNIKKERKEVAITYNPRAGLDNEDVQGIVNLCRYGYEYCILFMAHYPRYKDCSQRNTASMHE